MMLSGVELACENAHNNKPRVPFRMSCVVTAHSENAAPLRPRERYHQALQPSYK